MRTKKSGLTLFVVEISNGKLDISDVVYTEKSWKIFVALIGVVFSAKFLSESLRILVVIQIIVLEF